MQNHPPPLSQADLIRHTRQMIRDSVMALAVCKNVRISAAGAAAIAASVMTTFEFREIAAIGAGFADEPAHPARLHVLRGANYCLDRIAAENFVDIFVLIGHVRQPSDDELGSLYDLLIQSLPNAGTAPPVMCWPHDNDTAGLACRILPAVASVSFDELVTAIQERLQIRHESNRPVFAATDDVPEELFAQ